MRMNRRSIRTTRVSIVKLLLLIIVTGIVGSQTTFAKYTSTSTGTSTARVAKWAVQLVGNNATLSATNDGSDYSNEYVVTVKSSSEVKLTYNIRINNVPAGVTASLDGGAYTPVANGTNTITFATNAMYFNPVTTQTPAERQHTLRFKASSDSPVGANTMQLEVIYVQVD